MGSLAAPYDIRRHGSDLGPVRPFKPARPRGHISAPHSCFRTWTCSQSLRPLRNDVSRQNHAPWGWSDARPAATFPTLLPTLPEIEEACMLRIQGADLKLKGRGTLLCCALGVDRVSWLLELDIGSQFDTASGGDRACALTEGRSSA